MNLYDQLYDVDGINYGKVERGNDSANERQAMLLNEIKEVVKRHKVADDMKVVEIGASLGYNHPCHPNYLGIEYSSVAVDEARKRHGQDLNIKTGDVTSLDLESDSVDFLFTFATLEHVPEIGKALSEIQRVLKSGGRAYLSVAWNCRIWTVEKLECIPDAELSFIKLLEKKLIPLREHLLYRFTKALPLRLIDELKLALSNSYELRYKKLPVNFDLIEKYGHEPDDDAFINLDAHSAMCWYRAQGFKILSHPSFLKRILCRGEAILIQKP